MSDPNLCIQKNTTRHGAAASRTVQAAAAASFHAVDPRPRVHVEQLILSNQRLMETNYVLSKKVQALEREMAKCAESSLAAADVGRKRLKTSHSISNNANADKGRASGEHTQVVGARGERAASLGTVSANPGASEGAIDGLAGSGPTVTPEKSLLADNISQQSRALSLDESYSTKHLRQELESVKMERDGLIQKLNVAKQVESRLVESQTTVVRMSSELQSLKDENGSLQERQNKANEKLSKTVDQLNAASKAEVAAVKEATLLRTMLASAHADRDVLKNSLQRENDEIVSLQTKSSGSRTLNETCAAAQIEKLKQDLVAASATNVALQRKQSRSDRSVADLSNEKAALELELVTAGARNTALQSSLSMTQGYAAFLGSKLQTNDSGNAPSEAKLTTSGDAAALASVRCNTTTRGATDLDDANTRMLELMGELEKLKAQSELRSKETDNAKEELSVARQRLQMQEKLLKALSTKADLLAVSHAEVAIPQACQDKLSGLEQSLESSQADNVLLKKDLLLVDRKAATLEAKISVTRQELLVLGSALASANKAKIAFKGEADATKLENETLQNTLLAAHRTISELTTEVEAVRNDFAQSPCATGNRNCCHRASEQTSTIQFELEKFREAAQAQAEQWGRLVSEKNIQIENMRRQMEQSVSDRHKQVEELRRQLQRRARSKQNVGSRPVAQEDLRASTSQSTAIKQGLRAIAKSAYGSGATFGTDSSDVHKMCSAAIDEAIRQLRKGKELGQEDANKIRRCFSDHQIRCWVKVIITMQQEQLYSGDFESDCQIIDQVNDRDTKNRICNPVMAAVRFCSSSEERTQECDASAAACTIS